MHTLIMKVNREDKMSIKDEITIKILKALLVEVANIYNETKISYNSMALERISIMIHKLKRITEIRND